jgi:hypothetical protein
MAERPVFIPAPDAPGLVRERSLTITWAGGFAAVQKQKNVKALHSAAAAIGIGPVLEASTKSERRLGQHLSAFHLKVKLADAEMPLECAFQGSKVFEKGGPYTDLYLTDARSAKRDPRLHESGGLIAFEFDGHRFPLEPKTVFYDWLYINAISPHRDYLNCLDAFAGFSDIEFNPQKSLNCQARSIALFVSLRKTKLLDEAISSPESFIKIMSRYVRRGMDPAAIASADASSQEAAASDAPPVAPIEAAPVVTADAPAPAVSEPEAIIEPVVQHAEQIDQGAFEAVAEPVAGAEPQQAAPEAAVAQAAVAATPAPAKGQPANLEFPFEKIAPQPKPKRETRQATRTKDKPKQAGKRHATS